MQGAMKRGETRRKRKKSPEPWIGSVRYSPGPDAEDRLRRLVTLLISLASEARERRPEAGSGTEHVGGGDK